MAVVHPSALVDSRAKLADSVQVGPFALIGPDVELADSVVVEPHAVVAGRTTIDSGTRIFPFAHIGGEPQDKSFGGEATRLVIGRDNVIRESVTISVGTRAGGGCTRIGDDNLIMHGAHVAHDCSVGSHTILGAYTALGGHVTMEDFAVLASYTGVHQFGRIGESVMTAANSMLSRDAPPFAMVAGDRARLAGLNIIGLKRRGFSREAIAAIKHAFHILFHSKLRWEPALVRVREELADSPEVMRLVGFVEKSERGIVR